MYICKVKLEEALKSSKFKNPVQRAGLNVLYTAWWLKTMSSKELKNFDLTHEQYNVLRILKGKHPEKMCVKDIASRMIEKNSNVPRIIDRLESKSLIERGQGEVDGRQTVMALTKTGVTVLENATEALNLIWENVISISEDDANNLNSLLEKLRIKE